MSSILMISLLSACGGGNGNAGGNAAEPKASAAATEAAGTNQPAADSVTVDTSQPVTLKMIFVGPKPVDYDQVFGEINKQLKEKINTTLEAEFLDWSDWAQKYPLKLAANEDFDLIYAANWAGYNDQALKGGFLELTNEMLEKYAPMTWKAMPEVAWGQAKVNGKLYMVPQNRGETVEKLILYREDLRKNIICRRSTALRRTPTISRLYPVKRRGLPRSYRRPETGSCIIWTGSCSSSRTNGICSTSICRWASSWMIRPARYSTYMRLLNSRSLSTIIKI